MSEFDTEVKISDFTTVPGARFREDGDGSAQEFYEDILKPALDSALENKQTILLNFDGTWGYASSFISELAKRTVLDYKKTRKELEETLLFKSNDELSVIERFWNEYAKNYSK